MNRRIGQTAKLGGTVFQPVNPWKTLGSIWHKRCLPHIESPYATYFVTFRCVKGLKTEYGT